MDSMKWQSQKRSDDRKAADNTDPNSHVFDLGDRTDSELLSKFPCEQQSHRQFQRMHHSHGVFDPGIELTTRVHDQILNAERFKDSLGFVAVVREQVAVPLIFETPDIR